MSRRDDSKLLEWSEHSVNGTTQLLLAPFMERNSTRDSGMLNRFVKGMAATGADKEMRRLLYVACTRAKRVLHMTATLKTNRDDELSPPKKQSLLSLLWPILQESFASNCYKEAEILGSLEDSDEEQMPAPMLHRIDDSWVMPKLPIFKPGEFEDKEPLEGVVSDVAIDAIEFTWAGSQARHIGTVVHGQLQEMAGAVLPELSNVDSFVAERKQSIRIQLLNLGMPSAEIEKAIDSTVHALGNCLNEEQGRWVLQDHREAQSEWALSSVHENKMQRIVIDRTFIDERDVRWIIDYKTGDHKGGDIDAFLDSEQERYSDQLNRYANIVATLDPRPIKIGLYFPLLGKFRAFEPASIADDDSVKNDSTPVNTTMDLFGDN